MTDNDLLDAMARAYLDAAGVHPALLTQPVCDEYRPKMAAVLAVVRDVVRAEALREGFEIAVSKVHHSKWGVSFAYSRDALERAISAKAAP